MKIIKILLIAACLLGSIQAMACDVYIKVTNESGHDVDGVYIGGPWGRSSTDHDLTNGASFTYHATGSMFTCHGKYNLDSLARQDKCNYDDISIDMNSDGTAYFVITSVDGGAACNITVSSVK